MSVPAVQNDGLRGGGLWQGAGIVALLGLAGAAATSGWQAWRGMDTDAGQVTRVCHMLIVTGLGVALCVAGAMGLVDRMIRESAPCPWWLRISAALVKRLFLLTQLAAMAVVLAAAAAVFMGVKLPSLPG